MKEVLDLHYNICTGPSPCITLWQDSTTSVMNGLEDLWLPPSCCTNDVSDLELLPHSPEPHVEIEEDFEDHAELQNEVLALE